MLFRSGCPAADLIGKAERDLFPPDVAAALEADNLAALGETGLRETEERVVRPDGTEAWTQTTKGRIQDASGRVVGMFGVVRDITAPKLAERTAAEQASRYRAALDAMIEAAVIVDRSWTVVYANPGAAALAGPPAGAIVGRQIDDIWAGLEVPEARERLESCLHGGLATRFSAWFRLPGRDRRWLDVAARPIPEGMLLLALDTTESRLAQEALHRSELRFREVTETLFDPLVILSPIRNETGDVEIGRAHV